MRQTLTTLAFLLPPCSAKNRLLNLLGHDVHATAIVGICLVRRVQRFEIGETVLIGHFNLFRDLALVRMGRGARIVMFNSILGDSGYEPGAPDSDLKRTLRMEPYSHIISHHYLDCGGGVLMDEESWLTGIRTTVLTHAFDPDNGGILLDPVVLNKRVAVGTCCTMLPGTVLAEGAVLAAGSTTWTGQQVAGGSLSGGVPARRLTPMKIPAHAYKRARYDA